MTDSSTHNRLSCGGVTKCAICAHEIIDKKLSVPPHAAGEDAIDGELLDTVECSAYPNEGRCTHVRCILRERNSLAALVKRLRTPPAASQAAPERNK